MQPVFALAQGGRQGLRGGPGLFSGPSLQFGFPEEAHGVIVGLLELGCPLKHEGFEVQPVLLELHLASTDLLERPIPFGPRPQAAKAVSQVPRQFLEEPDFRGGKSRGYPAIDREYAEDLPVSVEQGERNRRSIAPGERRLAPRSHHGVGRDIAEADRPGRPYGLPDRPAPEGLIGPGFIRRGEIGFFDPAPRHGTHAPGFVMFDLPDPGHPVARVVADQTADVVKELLLVGRPDERLVTVTERPELPVGLLKKILSALQILDIPDHGTKDRGNRRDPQQHESRKRQSDEFGNERIGRGEMAARDVRERQDSPDDLEGHRRGDEDPGNPAAGHPDEVQSEGGGSHLEGYGQRDDRHHSPGHGPPPTLRLAFPPISL